jgi:hypothetical protein
MYAYPHKVQVQIVVVLMALHNYIGRTLHDYVAFAKFDRKLNFIFDNFLADIVAH